MSNQIQNKVNNSEAVFEANGEEVRLTAVTVRNYLTRGNAEVEDQEVVMFINLCKYQKLNPFLNEAYLVKFKGAPAQIITSKEAFMKRANRNTSFDGMKAGLILLRNEEVEEVEGSFSLSTDKLLGAWCDVYLKDKKYPMSTKINLDEFHKGQSTWNKMPKTMIRKTAIVQALREAFPEDLGALYTEEEADNVTADTPEQEIKEKANTEELDFGTEEKVEESIVDAEFQEVKEKQINGQVRLEPSGETNIESAPY